MSTVESSGLVHDAFVYASDEEFLAGALPFLEEGIDLREPIIAAPTPANSALLRARLGRQAKAVDWAEGQEAQRTVERHAILLQFIDRQQNRGATRIRVFGEPCWPSGGPGVAEWKRYESFLNVALADYPVWMVCPYDASRLSQDIVEDALLTHPAIGYGAGRTPSPGYLEPSEFAKRIDDIPLPRPPEDASERYFGHAGAVRRFVGVEAYAAGLSEDRRNDAELAAGESRRERLPACRRRCPRPYLDHGRQLRLRHRRHRRRDPRSVRRLHDRRPARARRPRPDDRSAAGGRRRDPADARRHPRSPALHPRVKRISSSRPTPPESPSSRTGPTPLA